METTKTSAEENKEAMSVLYAQIAVNLDEVASFSTEDMGDGTIAAHVKFHNGARATLRGGDEPISRAIDRDAADDGKLFCVNIAANDFAVAPV